MRGSLYLRIEQDRKRVGADSTPARLYALVSEKNSSRKPGEQRQENGPEVKRAGPVLSDPPPLPTTYYLDNRLLYYPS